jgi:hypothetical protein
LLEFLIFTLYQKEVFVKIEEQSDKEEDTLFWKNY